MSEELGKRHGPKIMSYEIKAFMDTKTSKAKRKRYKEIGGGKRWFRWMIHLFWTELSYHRYNEEGSRWVRYKPD